MRDFSHAIGDDAEIFFYLYDGNRMRQVSERFVVKIHKNNPNFYVPNLRNCAVFTDLGNFHLNLISHGFPLNFFLNFR